MKLNALDIHRNVVIFLNENSEFNGVYNWEGLSCYSPAMPDITGAQQ